MKIAWIAAAVLIFSGAAQAHEVWVERDGKGPARIYLGEPAQTPPPGGDPEFANLKAPRIVARPSVQFERKTGFLEAKVPAGDVRVWDDNVFAPWGDEGKKEGVIYYARAGRAETRAVLPFEIVPAAAKGNRFVLIRDGKPVAGAKVTVVSPTRVSTEVVTDATGSLTQPFAEPGRYLLSAAAKDAEAYRLPRGEVGTVHRITTTTFTVP